MYSRYKYGRDNRSDKKYKLDNYIGKYNQIKAAEQYIIDKQITENITYKIEMLKEEAFGETDDQIKPYQPDCKIYTPSGEYWLEIKVQMKPPKEDVHIKENQINKLVELDGYVLYSMQSKYFIHSAKWLKQNSKGVEYSQRLYKRCYIIDNEIINWVNWLHKPEFIDYYKEYGNYTKKQEGKR
jgi:hypothetical protein